MDRILAVQTSLPTTVRLVAVTKTVPTTLMRAAYQAGVRHFAESRVQEALAKQAELRDLRDITWHFIGHLQSNKALRVLESFSWIHSLDTLKLAEYLNALGSKLGKRPQVCLQVKILPDDHKFGWSPDQLWREVGALEQCTNLDLCGLMTIPPQGLPDADIAAVFAVTRELAAAISQGSRLSLHDLSMGMSGDYQLAVAAGATMVRLGTILFGDRPVGELGS